MVQEGRTMTTDEGDHSLGAFAAIINSRLAAESRIANAVSFAWLCGGWAIACILIGAGAALALWGYGTMVSVVPAAELTAKALGDAFKRAEIKTIVSGVMSLSPESELTIAKGQSIHLLDGASVKLDPSSSVRIIGDLKVDVPQPSKQQLQLEATTESKELPFTRYTVFNTATFGSGTVVTGWSFDLSDTTRPTYQRCYYEQVLDKGVAATQTVAIDASPRRPSALTKLSFDFDGALANCIWFSGT
jgi:hypothetical protein